MWARGGARSETRAWVATSEVAKCSNRINNTFI